MLYQTIEDKAGMLTRKLTTLYLSFGLQRAQ
jgi:hypothetical protein